MSRSGKDTRDTSTPIPRERVYRGDASKLTSEERELVDLYRLANPQGRRTIMVAAMASSGWRDNGWKLS